MNRSDKLVRLIAKAKLGDKRDLAHLARVVSYNLTGRELKKSELLELLNQFRGTAVSTENNDDYTRAYFDALLEVVAAYSCELKDQLQKEEDLNFLREEGFGPVMCALLSKSPKSLDAIVAELENPQNSAEKIKENLLFLQMWEVGLVEKWGEPGVYALTLRGEEFAKKLKYG